MEHCIVTKLVGVKFSELGFPKYYNSNDVEGLKIGDYVVVESENNIDKIGIVVCACPSIPLRKEITDFQKILRIATSEERETLIKKERRQREALFICKEKVAQHGLGMKVATANYDEQNNKMIFHFTADKRVDFRELVKDLAQTLKAKIELWQIGVRDEAKIFDGYGQCGCRLCCANHITSFESVTIKMAKDQDISLSPTKLSGVCGRLMCCLAYEEEFYKELRRNYPEIGSVVTTSLITGTVVDRNLIKQTLTIQDEIKNTHIVSVKDVISIVSVPPEPKSKQEVFGEEEKSESEKGENYDSCESDTESSAEANTDINKSTDKETM